VWRDDCAGRRATCRAFESRAEEALESIKAVFTMFLGWCLVVSPSAGGFYIVCMVTTGLILSEP
jgi:hypothetical protein